jgi:hypothetical protein
VLHHSRKQSPNGKDTDARESPRGTGAIFAAVDVVLQLTKADDGAMLVTQTKARAGKAVDPFIVRIEDVGAAGTRVHAGEPAAADQDGFGAVATLQSAKGDILRLLAQAKDVKSRNDLYRRVSGRKKTKQDALDELTEHGLVVVHEGFLRLASEVGK